MNPPPSPSDHDTQALERKLARLVAQQRYSQALRVRGQALRRNPQQQLKPSEAELWCLEGQQAVAEQQPKRAESALSRAIELGLHGEPHYQLARLWLQQGQAERALSLLESAFEALTLPPAYAGAYLKLLFLQGEGDKVRERIQQHPRRFLPQQRHWAAGILSLQAGDAAHARRQFALMAGPSSPGDHASLWRAWSDLELGDHPAAASALRSALQQSANAACVAVTLDLAARTGQRPGELFDLEQKPLPRRELVLALELLHLLRQRNLLPAAQLLLGHERLLLAAVPELEPLRRPLLLLAGQQALEREAPLEAIQCWRPIVERPLFDADLALRLYPLLQECEGDDHPELAERLASLLQGWVRRSARDSSSAWPEPLLSTTLARLLCWQIDSLLELGSRQQARRCLQQAQQLAPNLPDVLARQGMLAFCAGDPTTALPLLWQALEGGCTSRSVYEVLEAALETCGQEAELQWLWREHGARFGMPQPQREEEEAPPAWLLALSHPTFAAVAQALEESPASDFAADPALQALRILVEHSTAPPQPSRKATLDVLRASGLWDALLQPLPAEQQVGPLAAILAAIHRFCSRSGKLIRVQLEARQAQLEALAARVGTPEAEPAAQALLVLLGLRIRNSAELEAASRPLLRRSPQPGRLLARALLDLRLFGPTRPWRTLLEPLQRQDPGNALLLLAAATLQRSGSYLYFEASHDAFELARRQQDGEALAACRREAWWQEEWRSRALPPGFEQALLRSLQEMEMRIEPLPEQDQDPPRRGRRRGFQDL